MNDRPNKPPNRPSNKPQSNSPGQRRQSGNRDNNRAPSSSGNIKQTIVAEITGLAKLSDYRIRTLVTHASEFGPYLKNQRLETNQIRKFLDAINRVKAQLVETAPEDSQSLPADVEDEIVLLKPKLAYAAARQKAALPLSEVMSAAIDKTQDFKDFDRLVQFIESIIAYHKAEGGK